MRYRYISGFEWKREISVCKQDVKIVKCSENPVIERASLSYTIQLFFWAEGFPAQLFVVQSQLIKTDQFQRKLISCQCPEILFWFALNMGLVLWHIERTWATRIRDFKNIK